MLVYYRETRLNYYAFGAEKVAAAGVVEAAGPWLILGGPDPIIRAMFRLTREVRFSINQGPDEQLSGKPTNSYAGFPTMRGIGHHLTLQVTVSGPLNQSSQYLVNIKEIDRVVRERGIPLIRDRVLSAEADLPAALVEDLCRSIRIEAPGVVLEDVTLLLSPFLSYGCRSSESPMVRVSQKFEFSATHRLHNPSLSEDENCRIYGKCNNPHGHGHNYEVQVTLKGTPGKSGLLLDVPAFERIVAATVIDRFDHKNLNVELPEFAQTGLIPSVENIAMTIYRLLKPKFGHAGAALASVTVWETPKTWCEYSE